MKLILTLTIALLVLISSCKKKDNTPKISKITSIISHMTNEPLSKEISITYEKDKNQIREVNLDSDVVGIFEIKNEILALKDSYRLVYSYDNGRVSKISMYSSSLNQLLKIINFKYISNLKYQFEINDQTPGNKIYNPIFTMEVETNNSLPISLKGISNPKFPDNIQTPFDYLKISYDKNNNVRELFLTQPNSDNFKIVENTAYDIKLQNPLKEIRDLWYLHFIYTHGESILTVKASNYLTYSFTDFFSQNCIVVKKYPDFTDGQYNLMYKFDQGNRIIEKRYTGMESPDFSNHFQYTSL